MTSCDTSKFKESNNGGNEKSDPYCGVRGWPLVVGVEWTGGRGDNGDNCGRASVCFTPVKLAPVSLFTP